MSKQTCILFFAAAFSVACLLDFSAGAKKKDKKESETTKEAKEHFKSGVELYEKKEYSAALDEFIKSFELRHLWSVRYNMGLCHLELGFVAEGATELYLYLEEGGKHVKNNVAKEVNAILIDLLPELGTIVIYGDLKGLSLEIDGKKKAGPTGKGEVFVHHGTFDFSLFKNGKEILKKEISIEKGEIIELDLKKEVKKYKEQNTSGNEEDPGGQEEIKVDNPPAGNTAGGTEENNDNEKGGSGEERPLVKRLWLWTALGVTGATLAGGAAMGIVAVQERNAMRSDEDKYRLQEETATEEELKAILSSIDNHHDKGKIYSKTATALLSIAAAAGITSIILLVLTERKVKEKKKAFILFTPQLAGGTLTVVY